MGYQAHDTNVNGQLLIPDVNKHGCHQGRVTDWLNGLNFDKSKPFFLLFNRGGCSFAQKIRNAQDLGASALIIQDHKDGKGNDTSPDIANQDGVLQFHIPMIEIGHDDALKLRDTEGNIFVKISTIVSKPGN